MQVKNTLGLVLVFGFLFAFLFLYFIFVLLCFSSSIKKAWGQEEKEQEAVFNTT